MKSAVSLRSPAIRRASLSQRVARIELPPLSRRSQPHMTVRSPDGSMRIQAVSLPLKAPALLVTRHSNGTAR